MYFYLSLHLPARSAVGWRSAEKSCQVQCRKAHDNIIPHSVCCIKNSKGSCHSRRLPEGWPAPDQTSRTAGQRGRWKTDSHFVKPNATGQRLGTCDIVSILAEE
jgi:hypothetical protein